MEKFLKIIGITLLVFVMVILSPLLLTVAIFVTYVPELLVASIVVFGGFIGMVFAMVWLIRK